MAKDDRTEDTMSTSEAGQMGGEATREKYGPEHYSKIGKQGGDETAKKGPEFYSEIGKMQDSETNPGNFKNRPKDDVADAGRKGGQSRGDNN